MTLLWILFGMIITLDVIVYGLYRMIKKRPTVKKVMDIEVKNGVYQQGQIYGIKSEIEGLGKGNLFILSELNKLEEKIYKIEKKLKPKRKKLGRPRKPGPKKKAIRKEEI